MSEELLRNENGYRKGTYDDKTTLFEFLGGIKSLTKYI